MQSQCCASLVVDNGLAREGLKRILLDGDFEVVQAVPRIDDLLDRRDLTTHVVIVDYHDDATDAFALVVDLIDRFPNAKIAILSDQFDVELMRDAFEAGASGYILKDVSPQTFLAKIRLILMNERVAPSKLIDLVALSRTVDGPGGGHIAPINRGLTDREQEILDRLALGQPNKVISRDLKISEATVKVGLRAIFRKLSVKNRTQAAMKARESNLVSDRARLSVNSPKR